MMMVTNKTKVVALLGPYRLVNNSKDSFGFLNDLNYYKEKKSM